MLCCPSALVVFIEPKLKLLQPFNLLVAVVLCSLGADDVLEHDAAILVELIPPVAVLLAAEVHQVLDGEGLVCGLGGFLDYRCCGHGSCSNRLKHNMD